MGRTSGRLLLVLAVLAAIATGGGAARGERSQVEGVVVSLNGGVSPRELPRNEPAPVAVRLAGRVITADDAPLPRVNWIRLELAWRGLLDTQGLPVCPRTRLLGADSETAAERCRESRVGHGGLFARMFVPNQPAFDVKARITAFNGRTKAGRPVVLVHSYATAPLSPSSSPSVSIASAGSFRTVLVALIRRSVGPWPRVSNFHIDISRNFRHTARREATYGPPARSRRRLPQVSSHSRGRPIASRAAKRSRPSR